MALCNVKNCKEVSKRPKKKRGALGELSLVTVITQSVFK